MATKRKSKGAYMISAVAEMYEIHPQTLRLYEREGLLLPSRSDGNTRLYTDEDLERLEFILNLARDLGVNIAGIAIVLQMRERMEEMNRQMQGFVDYVRTEMLARMQQQQQPGLGLVPMPRTAMVPQRAAAAKVVAIPGKALYGKAAAVSEKAVVLKSATTSGKSAGKSAKGK
jgi:MerR family transcriptional regulator/heat shock protein HspR